MHCTTSSSIFKLHLSVLIAFSPLIKRKSFIKSVSSPFCLLVCWGWGFFVIPNTSCIEELKFFFLLIDGNTFEELEPALVLCFSENVSLFSNSSFIIKFSWGKISSPNTWTPAGLKVFTSPFLLFIEPTVLFSILPTLFMKLIFWY